MKLRILVFAVIVVLFVSFYATVVPSIELCSEKALVKSLVLVGHDGSSSFVTLRMGDTLKVVAEVDDVSSAYFLTIRDEAGEVLSKSGGIDGSSVEVEVLLHSPSFDAGKSYVVLFSVYAFNYPLPGVVISGRGMVGFAVDYSETRLGFEVDYDGVFRSIGLCANLTNVDGYPVVDETVSFCTRSVNGRQRRTDGWIPIGSARTNDSGIAYLSLAFSVPDGNYSFRALHDGDENFGESEDVTAIEVFSNMTNGDFDLSLGCESSFESTFSVWSVGEVAMEVSNSTPYALLPMDVSARYSVDLPLEGAVAMYFFLDYMNITGYICGVEVEQQYDPPYYVYEGALFWGPEVVGSHKVIAGVVNGSIEEIILGRYGIGIVASGEVSLDIQPCPSNMILEYAEATYGDVLPVTAVFSKPRPYQAESTDYYVTTTLAPKIIYNGVEYAVDEPVGSIPLRLQKNGTLTSVHLTNGDGVASFPLELSFSDHITLNIASSLNESVTLYEQSVVERVVNFTKISVRDVATNGSEIFGLNYTICNHEEGSDEIYLGTENPVRAEVDLFGLPLWNASISLVIAKNISRCTTSSGSALIPSDSDCLSLLKVYETLDPSQRVKIRFDTGEEVYVDILGIVRIPLDATNLTVIEEPLIGDVNGDGVVDMTDVTIVILAYRSEPGDPNWDPRADLNNDSVVDMIDLVMVTGNYRDELTVEADLEFFETCLEKESITNNLGFAVETWEPSEVGKYVVEVKLPSSFNVTLASWSDVTQLNASTSVIGYFYVVKRPLDLSLGYTPSEPTLDDEVTMIANVFDLGLGEPAEDLTVEFHVYDMQGDWIDIGSSCTNSSGLATLSWTPGEYAEQCNDYWWFVVEGVVVETACTQMAEAAVNVDARYPTELEFLNGIEIHVMVGHWCSIDVELVRLDDGSPVSGVYIDFYINDEKTSWGSTNDSGIAHWDWEVEENGTYYMEAVSFSAHKHYKPSEARLVAVAEVVPVSILFDVQPKEFKPGDDITLIATVFNATSGSTLPDTQVRFYVVDETGDADPIGSPEQTNASGVATFTCPYHIGPNAYFAKASVAQTIVVSPVMLTVAEETELSLDVDVNDESNYEHTFSGRLLSYGEPVFFRQVKILVNATVMASLTTAEPDGSFSVTLDLQPAENKLTAYDVQAVFEGDEPCNATAYGYTPNGTEYAICTTIQYGFKPSCNATWLTVEPQATEVATPTKTPEELQQEARESGWLRVKPRFSWWYPWFRLHFIGEYNGENIVDVGVSPLPWADTGSMPDTLAKAKIDLRITDLPGLVITGMIFGEMAVWIAGNVGPWAFAAAAFMYIAYKLVTFGQSYNSVEKLWEFLVGNFISTVISAFRGLKQFLPSTFRDLADGVANIKNWVFAFIYKCVMIPLNIYLLVATWDRLVGLGAV